MICRCVLLLAVEEAAAAGRLTSYKEDLRRMAAEEKSASARARSSRASVRPRRSWQNVKVAAAAAAPAVTLPGDTWSAAPYVWKAGGTRRTAASVNAWP